MVEDRPFIVLVFRRLPSWRSLFFFLTATPRTLSVLRSISTSFRFYLADSLVSVIAYLTPKISVRTRVFSPEFPREKRIRSFIAGAPDAARSIRSSLIQPLLRSRRNSWLIRSYSTERACFRQSVISNPFRLPSGSDFHISAEIEKISFYVYFILFLLIFHIYNY